MPASLERDRGGGQGFSENYATFRICRKNFCLNALQPCERIYPSPSPFRGAPRPKFAGNKMIFLLLELESESRS